MLIRMTPSYHKSANILYLFIRIASLFSPLNPVKCRTFLSAWTLHETISKSEFLSGFRQQNFRNVFERMVFRVYIDYKFIYNLKCTYL